MTTHALHGVCGHDSQDVPGCACCDAARRIQELEMQSRGNWIDAEQLAATLREKEARLADAEQLARDIRAWLGSLPSNLKARIDAFLRPADRETDAHG